MKKRTKLLIVAAAAVLIAMTAFAPGNALANPPVVAEAQYSDIKDQFNIQFYSDGHCSVSGKSTTSGAVSIPQKVTVKKGDGISLPGNVDSVTYNATSIGSFNNNANITSLTIPEGIQTIGDQAFMGCTGLTGDLIIPDSVIKIGSNAFRDCTGLTGRLSLGKGLTEIEGYTFFNCGFTGSLTIPSSVTSIAGYAFQGCKGFNGTLTIPSSVTFIGWDAFRDCSGFTGTLTLPAAAAARQGRAFYGCKGFTALNLAPGLTEIKEEEFYGCSGMSGTLTIPDTVASIGSSAFSGCSGFTGNLNIPPKVTEINFQSFYQCAGFTGLSFSSQVTDIDNGAFEGCTGMRGTLTFPDSLTRVENNAFKGCGFTGDLKLPGRLTYLNSCAFACPNIDGTLTIPASVTGLYALSSPFEGMFRVKTIVNHSTTRIDIADNFISKTDKASYFVKSGTSDHLKAYIEGRWGERGAEQTISKGTYFRGGTSQPTGSDEVKLNKTKPSSVKAKVQNKKVTVTWKKIDSKTVKGRKLLAQIQHIQVQCAKDRLFKKIAANKKIGKTKTGCALNLKKNTTYYIRVRYVGKNKKSAWSKTIKVKTKK